ncbi:hypothetical protein ACI6QG_18845 [Roseococcus sp. DSY-14]|uniref:hypothetical protein n=1 Tax=Roseococcus sp. DSY-14 TaxID=3369650 RepID=UPI00387ACA8D
MNAAELRAAMDAFRGRALPAIQALQDEQGRAAILLLHAKDLVPLLETAIARTEEPGFDADPPTLAHLSDLFAQARGIVQLMLRHERLYLDAARDHAHAMAQLEGEAAALVQRARAVVPDPRALAAERREVFSTLREIEMLARLNPGDPNMRRAREHWEGKDAALRPREAVQELAAAFEPLAADIAALTRLAQLQRGTWLNIGQDLAIAAAPMGDGGAQARHKWTHSRVDARIQLASIRRMAERAAAYIAAAEPHGFTTA